MRILAILQRELSRYLWAPQGWLVLGLFLLVQGYSFYLLTQLVMQPQAPHGAVMRLFFGGTFLYWIFVIVVVSLITMRTFAEERRSGTLETLLTAPVRDVEVVLGKYLGGLLFYLLLWLPTTAYVLVLKLLLGDESLDAGPILASYLGTALLGAACVAVGVMCSALSRNLVMAALLTFTLLVLLLLVDPIGQYAQSETVRLVVSRVDLFDHLNDFARGVVDTRHVVFHLSMVTFCLTVAVKALDRRRFP